MAGFFSRLVAKERALRNNYSGDLSTPEGRRKAEWHFRYIDHAVLRVMWHNFFKLDEGAYRANQPSPADLKRYKDMGIRTIVNLRGVSTHSHYQLEAEACDNLGLNLISVPFTASNAPPKESVIELETVFRTIDGPFLMHCKSGADRAGLGSALYMLMVKGLSVAEASKQLHWKYLHLNNYKTGILDYFLACYAREHANNATPFLDWIKTDYDGAKMKAEFDAKHAAGKRRSG